MELIYKRINEIIEEAIREVLDDGNQSYSAICYVAIMKALKEYRNNILEELEKHY